MPPEAAAADGNAADQTPFGSDRARHLHYIDARLLTAIAPGTSIRALAYRRDAWALPDPMRRVLPGEPKQQPVWAVRIGTFAGDVGNPPSEYSPRGDSDLRVVFAGRVDFPDLPRPRHEPAPFAVEFPFAAPYVRGPGHLVIEHVVLHRKMVEYPYVLDAVEARSVAGRVVPLVADIEPCPNSGLRVYGRVTGAPGSMVLGLHGAPPLASVDLWAMPWWPTHAPQPEVDLAARGCAPSTLPFWTQSLRADASGSLRHERRYPVWPQLGGQRVVAQFLVARHAGWLVAPPLAVEFGASECPSAAWMSVVSGYSDAEVTDGFVQRARGPVVRFSYD